MLKLRIVYNEELIAYKRLFFLIEGRNLENTDYRVDNGFLVFTAFISEKLNKLLRRFEIETIWAPLWVEGISRGLFTNDAGIAAQLLGLKEIPKISWSVICGPIVFIDRNFYPTIIDVMNNVPQDWIYGGDVDPKRLITGGVLPLNGRTKAENYYQLPSHLTARMVDCYLQCWNFFVLPATNSIDSLKKLILANYKNTLSRRVQGKRTVKKFSDLGYAVYLDSADELCSLLGDQDIIQDQERLHFPSIPDLEGLDNEIWKYPVKVGSEDIQSELSYYRQTGNIDPSYYQYRLNRIQNLGTVERDNFIGKYIVPRKDLY